MVSPRHTRGSAPAQEAVRRPGRARNRSSSSSAIRPRVFISKRSRRISSTFPASPSWVGSRSRKREFTSGRRSDPAPDGLRHRSDRPAARRQTTGLRELIRHTSFLAGYQVPLRGQRRRQHLHDPRPRPQGAPFPSDLFTILATLGTTIHIGSHDYDDGSQAFPLIEMPTPKSLPDDAVILLLSRSVHASREYVQTHRIARRPQMSHPIVNAGFRFRIDERGWWNRAKCRSIIRRAGYR